MEIDLNTRAFSHTAVCLTGSSQLHLLSFEPVALRLVLDTQLRETAGKGPPGQDRHDGATRWRNAYRHVHTNAHRKGK